MRAAVYCRVSSEEQRERQSIQTQIAYAERYLAREGIAVSDWYKDDGVSGTIALGDRPEGGRLLRDARAGRFKALLMYKLDRLGRDALVILTALDDLERAGVLVTSMTETLDLATPHGRFMAVIQAGAAGYERDSIVQRSMEGSQRLARAGAWQGGIVPYGYRVEGRNREARLVVSEQTIPGLGMSAADVIRLIYRKTVVDEWSCYDIARHLTLLGVPTAHELRGRQTAGIWRASGVRNVLASTTYKGTHQYGKRKAKQGGEIIERDCPAIVDVPTWERAQEVLREHQTFSRRNAKREYLLRGLITCGTCGRSYCGTVSRVPGRGTERRYYACMARRWVNVVHGKGGQKCQAPYVYADELEAAILGALDGFKRNPDDVIRQLAAQMAEEAGVSARWHEQIASANAALSDLRRQRDTVIALFRKGRIDDGDLDRQLDQLADEEAMIRQRLAYLTEQASAVDTASEQLRDAETMLAGLRDLDLCALAFDERRRIVAGLVDGITVDTRTDERGRREPVIAVRYRFGDAIATGTPAHTDTNCITAQYERDETGVLAPAY